ncbi:MAG: hypothetical protein ACFFDV_00955 [Candidatus Thorarchaeota archaeon]
MGSFGIRVTMNDAPSITVIKDTTMSSFMVLSDIFRLLSDVCTAVTDNEIPTEFSGPKRIMYFLEMKKK